jgi:hypothetical protein
MLFLINFNRRDKTRGVNGTGWESYVQGLDACAEDIAAMDQNRAQIRQILNTKVRSIIDRWVAYCIKKNEMGRVAFLYAHSAFLWYNISQEDLTPDVLVSFLSSQLFLATRFHGSSQRLGKNAPLKRKLSKADAGEMYGNGMQCELFDIFQKHRGMAMGWLRADTARCNQVMEDVVRAVSLTASFQGESHAKNRFWRSMDGRNCVGRFVPSNVERSEKEQQAADDERDGVRGKEVGEIEVNLQLGTFSLNTSRLEGVDERIARFPEFSLMFGEEGQMAQCATIKCSTRRLWVRMVGRRHDLLLWKPDERVPALNFKRKYPDSLSSSERWIQEIMDQCRSADELLPGVQQLYLEDTYNRDSVVARLCGFQVITEDKTTVLREGELKKLGGTLLNKWNLRWFVLTGSQVVYFESQKDAAAGRSPKTVIRLADIREVGEVTDEPNEFYIITTTGRTLQLRASDGQERDAWIKTLAPKTSLVEMLVFREQRVLHIYNVVEHGRRFRRRLVYSSDWHFCLHEMPALHSPDGNGVYTKFGAAELMEAPEGAEEGTERKRMISMPVLAHESLVITRNLGNTEQDQQTFIPAALLSGLLPDALIDDYSFWQNEDDSLVGYHKPEISQRMQTAYVLRIKLVRQSQKATTASAQVVRLPLKHVARVSEPALVRAEKQWAEERSLGAERESQGMTLLNLLYTKPGSKLYDLAKMLCKLESLSHCLVWTKTKLKPGDDHVPASIDLIEMPRLQLTFFSKICGDGITRLFSSSHAGLFISARRNPALNSLLRGIPHGILLEGLDGTEFQKSAS